MQETNFEGDPEYHNLDDVVSKDNETLQDNQQDDQVFKFDHRRYNKFDFGMITTREIQIRENLLITAAATVTPTEGGIMTIPHNVSVIYISAIDPLIQSTILLPLKPKHGHIIIFTSNIDISSIIFDGNGTTFGMTMPTNVVSSTPIRLLYIGTWILI